MRTVLLIRTVTCRACEGGGGERGGTRDNVPAGSVVFSVIHDYICFKYVLIPDKLTVFLGMEYVFKHQHCKCLVSN